MVKNDTLYIGDDARQKLCRGFFKVADAVKGTLGYAGYNGMLEHHLYPHHLITNDGVSIARGIELADPVENMGANLAKEIATGSDKQGGDGTTTSLTLGQAIVKEGLEHLKDISPMELSDQLDACYPIIEKALDEQKKEITPSEVKSVASISAQSDEIGELIQEVYEKIGKDGILYPDISNTFDTYYTIGQGIQIKDAGMVSPYLSDFNAQGNLLSAATIKNAHILITKQKITSGSDLSKFLEALYNRHEPVKELVIFCDEIEALAIGHFIQLKVRDQRPFKAVIVKMPVLWKDWWYEDLAKMTGATIIDPVNGITYKNATFDHLGRCDSVVVDTKNTYLDGTQDISEWIKELEARNDDESKIRIARLNTKTARLFVGAKSETELSYKRLKVEDARNAAYLAMKDGIVAGGGSALVVASDSLPDTIGGKILKAALLVPAKQIGTNAGMKDLDIGLDYRDGRGFNAKTKSFVDMFEAGIVDPLSVVKSSVRNAISVASKVLTTSVIVTLPAEAKEPSSNMPTL